MRWRVGNTRRHLTCNRRSAPMRRTCRVSRFFFKLSRQSESHDAWLEPGGQADRREEPHKFSCLPKNDSMLISMRNRTICPSRHA